MPDKTYYTLELLKTCKNKRKLTDVYKQINVDYLNSFLLLLTAYLQLYKQYIY